MKTLKEYYVLSYNFDGMGRGFALGFSSEHSAYLFARCVLFGFGQVVEWWQLEDRFPAYYHGIISKTE